MELTVKERLLLLTVLPVQGNITTLRIVRELRERLSFTEEEHKEFGMKSEGGHPCEKQGATGVSPLNYYYAGGMVTWDKEKARMVDIPMGEKAMDLIIDSMKRADAAGRLTLDMIDLYDRVTA